MQWPWCTTHFFSSACVYTTDLISWRGRPSVVLKPRFLRNRSMDSSHILKPPIHFISRHSFFLFCLVFISVFEFLRFFWFVFANMGSKISKQYLSHSFCVISTELYGKYCNYGKYGRSAKINKFLNLFGFVNTGPYGAGNFKRLFPLQFSSDLI